MHREVLKSKIHRARLTETDLTYEGSLTLDPDLMDVADIRPYEKVHVLNVTTGERLTTYAIEGESGSREVCLNGAAARLGSVDDVVIVLTYATVDDDGELEPTIVHVNEDNAVTSVD